MAEKRYKIVCGGKWTTDGRWVVVGTWYSYSMDTFFPDVIIYDPDEGDSMLDVIECRCWVRYQLEMDRQSDS